MNKKTIDLEKEIILLKHKKAIIKASKPNDLEFALSFPTGLLSAKEKKIMYANEKRKFEYNYKERLADIDQKISLIKLELKYEKKK